MENIETLLSAPNVYIDESGHTDDPSSNTMVLGALWISVPQLSLFTDAIRTVKKKHDIASHREIKWTKVSPAKLDYYKELVDVFFAVEQVNYRAVVINKSIIDYEAHNKTRDDFYYSMTYILVRTIAEKRYGDMRLFLDYKDAWSGIRTTKLAGYLNNTSSLNSKSLSAQPVRSHEVVGLQISDLLTGAVMYANKPQEEQKSDAKKELIAHIERRSGQKLICGTPYSSEKNKHTQMEAKKIDVSRLATR